MNSFEHPISLPLPIAEGCKGCGGRWRSSTFSEGQCTRCKRCLNCCGDKTVQFSCAWRYERDFGGTTPERIGERVAHNRKVQAGIHRLLLAFYKKEKENDLFLLPTKSRTCHAHGL